MPRIGGKVPTKITLLHLCGLHRMCHGNGVLFNFLDKKDARFTKLQ